MPDEFKFSGEGLVALGEDLMAAANALGVESVAVLTEIGTKVEESARSIASSNGSTSIPGTIKGGMRDRYEYRIQAGDEQTPIASLWELGNRGRRSDRKTFDHPVFGRKPNVSQKKYPFLRPALKMHKNFITVELLRMWDRALTPYRLRPEEMGFNLGGGESSLTETLTITPSATP